MLETHPDVIQACVVPVDDDIKGTKPVAFVVKREGSSLDESRLKTFALENAPAYQHPRFIWFVDSLPLASTNKVDRNVLRELAAKKLQQAMASTAPAATGGQDRIRR
jgi:acyl-coenzyme A synthetase/AMP-(fatty) acid ligase